MKGTKKSLLASGLSLLASCALLAGTTFAWFTDSVTNSGNRIQAGTLDITAEVAEVDPNGTGFVIRNDETGEMVNGGIEFGFGTPRDIEQEPGAIIEEENWEPGKSSAKLLTVRNNGSLAAKITLQFTAEDGGLADALWYDFIRVENGKPTGTFTRREMTTLSDYAAKIVLPLGPSGDETLADSVSFILVYGMEEEAGNEYQGKSFMADVTILATQYTYEKDGFGDKEYDAAADYVASFTSGTHTIDKDFYASRPGGVAVNVSGADTVLNIMGGTVNGGAGGDNVAVWANNGATVNISDGTFTVGGDASGYGNSVIYSTGGTVNISGGFFYTDYAYNGRYYVLNQNNSNPGTITVTGGTFVNYDPSKGDDNLGGNFVADGYAVVTEQHGDDTWYIVVEEIDTAENLQEAIAEAEDGDTLVLSGDIQLTKDLTIDKNITIDGQNKTTISENTIHFTSKEVTIKNVTFNAPANASNNASSIYFTAPSVEKVVIDGCTFQDTQWDSLQLTSKNIKEVVITNCTFENTSVKGMRYIHLELRDNGAYFANPDAKLVMTNNTFINVSKEHVSDSAITILGFMHENMTIQGNKFEGDGADNLTTAVLWICNGKNFGDLLSVEEITK